MTRGQWIAVVLLVLLVFIAVAIGVMLWMRQKSVVVVDANRQPNGSINIATTPIVTGATKKVNNISQVKRPASTGATYREILGKRS